MREAADDQQAPPALREVVDGPGNDLGQSSPLVLDLQAQLGASRSSARMRAGPVWAELDLPVPLDSVPVDARGRVPSGRPPEA